MLGPADPRQTLCGEAETVAQVDGVVGIELLGKPQLQLIEAAASDVRGQLPSILRADPSTHLVAGGGCRDQPAEACKCRPSPRYEQRRDVLRDQVRVCANQLDTGFTQGAFIARGPRRR